MLVDMQNRVMVRILLDGTVSISDVRRDLRTLGVAVTAEEAAWRDGLLEAFLPLEQAEVVAQLAGIAAVNLQHGPRTHVGSVTSEGASLLKTDQVNKPGVVTPNGITGRGITIGILSDSFNLLGDTPTAFDDVTSGDLPSIGVPDGRPGLKFLSEGGDFLGASDEGRALAQIAYDIAPGASLCFASGGLGPLSFAASIRRLRTDSQCAADVLVDDISYPDEPAFSDGPIAKAVNDVVTSATLAGKPVTYVAAAGNAAGSVYASDFRFMADADARALTSPGVDLTLIPSRYDTSGGFHNFNPDPNGTPALSQLITISDAFPGEPWDIILQWDDAFDRRDGISTDLNLFVFDATGKTLLGISGDDNFSTLAPVEGIGTTGNLRFRFVIGRTGKGSHVSSKLMWYEDNPFLTVTADFLDPNSPSIFGHAGSKSAIAVGAYSFDNGLLSTQYTPELESFSSVGPFAACCDAAGNRLDSLEIRQKPEICGVDRVSTTFFNTDPTGSLSSFPGTSAAAPHIAGVAALLLEAAGGPKSLTADQVRSKLIGSAGQHDLDPNFSQAVLGDSSVSVSVKAQGAEDFASLTNTKFFTIQYSSSNAGQTLASVAIDLGPTGLHFNTNSRSLSGFAFKASQLPDGAQVTAATSGTATTILTLTFTGLQPGGVVQFGIGREQRTTRQDGLSADLLAGATVTATLAGPAATLNGSFVNQLGTGYMPADGFGLIDALKAVKGQ